MYGATRLNVMSKSKKDMKKELELYKDSVFFVNKSGDLQKIYIDSLDDYNHSECELHHFIQYQAFKQDPDWYKERGINQKLILVNKVMHEQIERRAIRNLTDDEFERKYKISRWKLLFNKRHSKY